MTTLDARRGLQFVAVVKVITRISEIVACGSLRCIRVAQYDGTQVEDLQVRRLERRTIADVRGKISARCCLDNINYCKATDH